MTEQELAAKLAELEAKNAELEAKITAKPASSGTDRFGSQLNKRTAQINKILDESPVPLTIDQVAEKMGAGAKPTKGHPNKDYDYIAAHMRFYIYQERGFLAMDKDGGFTIHSKFQAKPTPAAPATTELTETTKTETEVVA